MSTTSPEGGESPRAEPSRWVQRFVPLIRAGGTVLDLACGGGRHARYLSALGYRVVAVDIDVTGIEDLSTRENVEVIQADLETSGWPFVGRHFDGIVVTNYLYRPHLPCLSESLAPGGVLIYETFAQGHEALGPPRNPAFLLHPAELLDAFAGRLRVLAYQHAVESEPRPAVRQRICALNAAATGPASHQTVQS